MKRGILALVFGAMFLASLASPAQSSAALVPAACSIQGNASGSGSLGSETIVFDGSGSCSGVFDSVTVTDTPATLRVSETHAQFACLVDQAEIGLDGSLTLPGLGRSLAVSVYTTTTNSTGATHPAVIEVTSSHSAAVGVLTLGWGSRGACWVGEVNPTPFKLEWVVSVPDTEIDSGPSGLTSSRRPEFKYSSNVPGSSFQCRMDNAAFSSCLPTGYTSPDLGDGGHTFYVRAANEAGQVDPTPASRSFTVDTQAPDTSITSGPSGPTASASASFGFSSPDGTASFECRLDAGAWVSCASPKGYSALAQGSHTFEVRAKDQAGNADPTPASRTWTVDTQAPDTSITSGPSGPTASASFGFSSPDESASFECRLDAGAWASCSSPKAYSALAEGSYHTFEVRAKDQAGNADPTPASRSWTVDTTAPTIQLSGPLKDGADLGQTLTVGSYGLTVTSTDGQSGSGLKGIEILADGVSVGLAEQACQQGSCSMSFDWTLKTSGFSGGNHLVTVVVEDQLGQQREQSFTVTLPTETWVAPDTLPCTGADEPTNFETYSLGIAFENLPFTTVLRRCEDPYPGEDVRANYVSYIYGTCVPSLTEDEGCAPPLEIQSWPACERTLSDYELEPGIAYPRVDLGEWRGVPTYSFDEQLRVELYTGESTVVIFGSDAPQLLRAISGIRAVPASQPPARPPLTAPDSFDDLPAPASGAMTGELPCVA